MELENTPKELRNATIELLNYLLSKKNIDVPLYKYFSPNLNITNYTFNTLKVFQELLAILRGKVITTLEEYLILKRYLLLNVVKIDLEYIPYRMDDKYNEYLELFYKYKTLISIHSSGDLY